MMATSSYPHAPSAFSPLETLVRRTSSRRRNPPPNVKTDLITPPRPHQQQLAPNSPLIHTHFRNASNATASSKDFNSSFMDFEGDELDPRDVFTRDEGARDSFDSYQRSHYNSFAPDVELQQRFQYVEENDQDHESNSGSALRDSWQSGVIDSKRTVSQVEHGYYPTTFEYKPESGPPSPVPAVVITSPDSSDYPHGATPNAGRAPIVRSVGAISNYSRPVLGSGAVMAGGGYGDLVHSPSSDAKPYEMRSPSPNQPGPRARHASSSAPILHPEHLDPDAKRRVLERNLSRRARGESPSPILSPSISTASGGYDYAHSPSATTNSSSNSSTRNLSPSSDHSSQTMSPSSIHKNAQPYSESQFARYQAQSFQPQRPGLSPQAQTQARTPSSSSSSYTQEIILPRRPPSHHDDSPVSLYSDAYSFYQLDSASPSPTSTAFNNRSPSGSGAGNNSPLAQSYSHNDYNNNRSQQQLPPPQVLISPSSPNPNPSNAADAPKSKAEHYLALGIKHHEANDLTTSAQYFQKSATENGGCGVGMLMWGLALRHGWGVAKDQKSGFGWVRKAAEGAVRDLEEVRKRIGESTGGGASGGGSVGKGMGGGLSVPGYENDKGAVKAELVLAIYEVGQCFFHGWGVHKDQKMGVSYYRVAAQLGDMDAQGDLGFCLANGKGCKKDRKEAAKWYRSAVAQGYSDVGLAWIHKEKFQ